MHLYYGKQSKENPRPMFEIPFCSTLTKEQVHRNNRTFSKYIKASKVMALFFLTIDTLLKIDDIGISLPACGGLGDLSPSTKR